MTRTAMVAKAPGSQRPMPNSWPMAAVVQTEAAVVRPWTVTPSLKITPAPMKPTPVMTPCETRLGSSSTTPDGKLPALSIGR